MNRCALAGVDNVRTPSTYSPWCIHSDSISKTTSTLASFISMMLLHPEEQTKIQLELDKYLTRTALPGASDISQLPYLDAALRESMRLNTSAPLGQCSTVSCLIVALFFVCFRSATSRVTGRYLQWDVHPRRDNRYSQYRVKNFTTSACGNLASNSISLLGSCAETRKFGRSLICTAQSVGSNPITQTLAYSRISKILFSDLEEGEGLMCGYLAFLDETCDFRICPGIFLANQTIFMFAAAILQSYDIIPLDGEPLPKEFVYNDAIVR